MKFVMCLVLFGLLSIESIAQITGTVKGLENGKLMALPGASVYWEGTETGAITGPDGRYSLPVHPQSKTLVVSFIGYQPQSKVIISRKGTVNFELKPLGTELNAAEVVGRVDATSVDLNKAGLTYKIDDKELRKAACCNLSESFETNATVDVSFTDAVTGTRQIEMLGLSGKYVLIQRENIPFARGLNATSGLTYVPGPFVESIQLTKGLSSVLNGYESISGQINIELYKPETAPRLYLNAFGNQGSRMELNVMSALPVREGLSTAILAHASQVLVPRDGNGDGFADIPTGHQLNFTNRWHFENPESGWEGQLGISVIRSEKNGGTMAFIEERNPADRAWGYQSTGQRVEFYGKNGYVFKNKPFRSIGIIYSLGYQDHEGRFGQRLHYGEQRNAYLNTIYEDILGTTAHKFRTGFSFQTDAIIDRLRMDNQTEDILYGHERIESVPGAFFEYILEPNPKFTLVAGIRGDYNDYFRELFVTPRLNLRYSVTENTTLRLGGGRGQRTPNAMMENLNLLASSRVMDFSLYSTRPEIAWNTGASIVQELHLGEKEIHLTVDAFYTWFDRKLVADLDLTPSRAVFTNAQGSNSFSLLGQIDYELFTHFELRLAYKYLRARDQFLNGVDLSYGIPEHRTFVNFAYRTSKLWKFDLTLNWFGPKRLPESGTNPLPFRRAERSPAFGTINAQVNKGFKNGIELFVGVDNLLDFRQDNPIIDAGNPYGPYFDTNFTWGPIFGRNIYLGLYYTLPDKKN